MWSNESTLSAFNKYTGFLLHFMYSERKNCFLVAEFGISVDAQSERGIRPVEAGCRFRMQSTEQGFFL